MATAESTAGRGRRFGGRDFALLWTGFTVSAFGTAVTTVALPLVALITLDASTFEVGVVSAATVAAWLLFGLSAGVWVDRFPHRPLLIVCDAVRAVAILSVPVAAFFDVLSLPQLVIVAFVISVGSVFFDIGFQTYIPDVLDSSELIVANSRLQGSESVAQVGGPSLGGAIVGLVGAPATLVIDACSYVVSGFSVLAIRKPDAPVQEPSSTRMLTQIREGLSFVARDPVLRPLAIAATVLNMFGMAVETLVIVFLTRTLDLPTGLVGVLLASNGLGGVLGAFAAGPLSTRMGGARALRLAVIAGPLLALLIPTATRNATLVLFAAGMVGIFGFTVVFSVIARTYRQLTTPPHLLGRVTATIRFVSWGVLPFGALLAGTLGEAFGTRTALWIVCVAFLLTPLPILASPMRRARDIPQERAPSDDAPLPPGGDGAATEPAAVPTPSLAGAGSPPTYEAVPPTPDQIDQATPEDRPIP